jgi:succinoglycan biosynthesis protein ExoO
MKWFLRSVWPTISARVPQAELRICGDIPEALARDWGAQPRVRVLGFVDELRSEYERAALIVTPITWGGGTKIKVLEAFAYGRVPVGPEHAFDGLADAPTAKAVAVTENDATRLAAAAVSLLNDPEQRFSRESVAVEYYQKHYSLDAFNVLVRNTVEGVIQRQQEHLGLTY